MVFAETDKQLPDVRVSLEDALDALRLAIVEAGIELEAVQDAAADRPGRLPLVEVDKHIQNAEWKVACLVSMYDRKQSLLEKLPQPVKSEPEKHVRDDRAAKRRARLGRS